MMGFYDYETNTSGFVKGEELTSGATNSVSETLFHVFLLVPNCEHHDFSSSQVKTVMMGWTCNMNAKSKEYTQFRWRNFWKMEIKTKKEK